MILMDLLVVTKNVAVGTQETPFLNPFLKILQMASPSKIVAKV